MDDPTRRRRFVRLLQTRAQIDAMIDHGAPFEEIEEYIEDLGCSAEAKSALWLWAWSHEPQHRQKKVALQALMAGD
jgi:hypothetical protein